MQLSTVKQWRFINWLTGASRSWNSMPQDVPVNELSPALLLFNKCSTTPMSAFLAALCDDDLTALVIAGTPTELDLQENWVNLVSEFQELRGDSIDTVDEIRLIKNIRRTQHALFIFEQAVLVLEHRWSASIAAGIYSLGFPFRPKSQVPEEYNTELRRTVIRAKAKYIQIEAWINELTALRTNRSEDDTKNKREDFERTLIQIEEMQKVAYNLDGLTVSKYVALENKLKRYANRTH